MPENLLIGRPAFILGNGPRLPIDSLHALAGQFTVGVNRILESGFTPTVIFWVDGSVYKEHGERIDDSGAILVCDEKIRRRQSHIGLRLHIGDAALSSKTTPTEVCVNGNTGCAAARWAFALGCNPIYLLGMSAEYLGGKTNFYGENKWHHRSDGDNGTLPVMRGELTRLKIDLGGAAMEISTGDALEYVAQKYEPTDRAALRGAILELISPGGI